MKKPMNPAILGAFVVGAVVVLVGAIGVFGSGNFFQFRPRFVMYFPGSIQGLVTGAPILFRGVQVGTVLEISAVYRDGSKDIQIPVIGELDRDKIRGLEPPIRTKQGQQDYVLDVGLRAQLVSQSFVTGQKAVAFDFYPKTSTEIKLHETEMPYAEIPTVESPLDKFSQKLESLPIDSIANDLQQSLKTINEVMRDPAIRMGIADGAAAMKDLRSLVALWAEKSQSIATNIDGLSSDLRVKIKSADIEGMSDDFESVARRAEKIMSDLDRLTVAGAPLEESLREFAGAARELRGLLEYLSRHPEALVQGRSGTK